MTVEDDFEQLELDSIGASVFAVGYGVDDVFPELRGLAWKRGAQVLKGGIHVHDPITVLAAIRARDGDDANSLLEVDGVTQYVHGDLVFASMALNRDVAAAKATLLTIAESRPMAAELCVEPCIAEAFLAAKQKLGHAPAAKPRLFASFSHTDAEAPAAFSASLGDTWPHQVVRNGVLFDSVERRKRIAVLALRRGGSVTATDGLHVEVKGHFWFEKPQKQKGSPAAEQRLVSAAALQTALGQASVETRETSWFRSVTATIVTDNPRQALLAMHTEATALGCHLAIWVDDLEPLRWALGRLMAEVERPSW